MMKHRSGRARWPGGNRRWPCLCRACALALALTLLALTGCGRRSPAPAPEEPAADPVPTAAAPAAAPVVIQPEATGTPQPASTMPPPTATPDPYTDGMAREEYAEGFYAVALNDALKRRITGLSYPAAGEPCEVAYDDLRYLRIQYVDFLGETHEGELIVNAALAQEVLEIFCLLYEAQYPLTSVRLVDDFGEKADDNASMAADNTSAFNYRAVAGTKKLSLHSYGAAIDINPRRNPYVKADGTVSPENGAVYADRDAVFAGKIDEDDLCYRLFTARGWSWGGHFKTSKDYQHFSRELGD